MLAVIHGNFVQILTGLQILLAPSQMKWTLQTLTLRGQSSYWPRQQPYHPWRRMTQNTVGFNYGRPSYDMLTAVYLNGIGWLFHELFVVVWLIWGEWCGPYTYIHVGSASLEWDVSWRSHVLSNVHKRTQNSYSEREGANWLPLSFWNGSKIHLSTLENMKYIWLYYYKMTLFTVLIRTVLKLSQIGFCINISWFSELWMHFQTFY